MKIKANKTKKIKQQQALKSELAMIEALLDGSPDSIGVAVVRLACGCRKMAAVDKSGEPASKVVIFRDNAESVCSLCKEDNGAFTRVAESFIHYVKPEPTFEEKTKIEAKVLGTMPVVQ